MTIHPLLLADLNEVCKIEEAAQAPAGWKRQMFVDELNNSCSHYWVAEQNNGNIQTLGFIGFHALGQEGYITNLSVHPDFQGQKVGERLLIHLIQKAVDWQMHYLTLEVRESNIRAQNLYKKYGFESKGVRPNYYPDTHENALIMWTNNIQEEAYKELFETKKLFFNCLDL